jgi:MFS family permease
MTHPKVGLWRQGDFRNLWLGLTASLFGAKITAIALPLIAALTLHSSPFELGLLVAADYLPYVLIGMVVGVRLDRRAKRPMLIVSDLFRSALLAIIPVTWMMGLLTVPLLLAISLLIGCCTVTSDIGSSSFLPSLVSRSDLIEANSKLELSNSASNIAGNSMGGGLIQAVSAPIALLVNCATYLTSAFFTALIKKREEQPAPAVRTGVRAEMVEGARAVFRHPTIRRIVLATLVFNLFTFLNEPIFLLFITRQLALAPMYIGLIFAASGVGALFGALIAERVSRQFGLGPALVGSLVIAGVAAALVPTATLVPHRLAPVLIIIMHLIDATMVIIYNVNQRSLRAALTPDQLQGRMNASIRMTVMGVAPLGAFLGGVLGGLIGVLWTLIVGALGILAAGTVVLCSHVRRLERVPEVPAVQPNHHTAQL